MFAADAISQRIDAPPIVTSRPSRLEVHWARHQDEVLQAQRLRYRVFVEEMGARIQPLPGSPRGVDADRFDGACEHLLVRTVDSDHAPSKVVGTYRVLTPAASRRTGGLYSEGEFDIASLQHLRPRMVELGRSCTATGWRRGGVILLLWTALAEFMDRNRLDFMIGCASVPMRDGGFAAARLWRLLQVSHLVAPQLRVHPYRPLPLDHLDCSHEVEVPALIKGYLRCGGQILGAPASDPDFGVADLPMMLDLGNVPAAYRARFMG